MLPNLYDVYISIPLRIERAVGRSEVPVPASLKSRRASARSEGVA